MKKVELKNFVYFSQQYIQQKTFVTLWLNDFITDSF